MDYKELEIGLSNRSGIYAKEGDWVEAEFLSNCKKAITELLGRANAVDITDMALLTVEQLKKMDGRPIWIEHDNNPKYNHVWMIWSNEIGVKHNFAGYNIFWRAYAYKPIYINLEAWMAEWVDNDKSEEMMCKCSKCGYPVSYFWGKTAFCPGCGRAMTQEAYAELKKRVMRCV